MHLAVTGSPRHLQTTKDHNFTIQLEITRMTSCLVTGISRDLCSFLPSHLLQICGYNSQLPRWNGLDICPRPRFPVPMLELVDAKKRNVTAT